MSSENPDRDPRGESTRLLPEPRGAHSARRAAEPAAEQTDEPAAKPEVPHAKPGAKVEWQKSVPFDETGVLMRPESLRHKAMHAETEIIKLVPDKTPQDDGSEAAQAQRPGFWTGARPRRALLIGILLLQALLTLRNNNSAFEDEALYLYAGHLELGHLLYGTSTGVDFFSYFSGAPTLYPVIGAIADQIGGLFGARLLSLLFMLGTTGMLYLLTRRLFGTRAGLYAAAVFSCSEATVFVGGLATYDAPALFLLAFSAWIVVRSGKSNFPYYIFAAFPAALAVGTKYAALMFVPVIVVMACFAAAPYFGKLALIRPVALTIAFASVIWAMLKIAGPVALQGVQSTTTNRAQGTDSVGLILKDSAMWGGCVFAVALLGAVFLVRLPVKHGLSALPESKWLRVLLACLLGGTALFAPAYQVHLHTAVSLQKHVGFGLFFAAPLAGYGLVRLVGPHFHRIQLGLGVLVLTFALGMGQSLGQFHVWPNSNTLNTELVKYQKPDAQYLLDSDEPAIYGLRGDPDAQPLQFSNIFFFAYTDSKGQHLTGNAAYEAAIADGYFQIIAYSGIYNPVIQQAIAPALYRNPKYKLVATLPANTSYGPGFYYVWARS